MSEPGGQVLAWAGVLVVALCAALAAVLEALLVPVYLGSTIFPIAVVFAIASNVVLPRMARALVPTSVAAVVPFAVWLVVIVIFGVVTRPEGDVILPGGSLEYVTYGVLLGGAIAGATTLVIGAPLPQRLPSGGGRDHPGSTR